MIYIKFFVYILIIGILTSVKPISVLTAVPEYFLCLTAACAFTDKNKTRSVSLSVLFAVLGSALTDRPLIYCTALYSVTAVLITETASSVFKKGLLFVPAVIGVATLIGEFVFYYIFIKGNIIVDFISIILNEVILNMIVGIILYLITYMIYNPRQRKFKIAIE